MTRKHDKNTEDILKDIPNGKIIINRHNSTHENTIFNKDFSLLLRWKGTSRYLFCFSRN